MIDLSRYSAAIFDMDGLLIDSEPLWQDAEIATYAPFDVPVTRELCRATAGRRIDEVLALWHERFDWQGPPVEEMVERVLAEVTRLIVDKGEALPGVHATMQRLRESGMKLAIASSSPPPLIEAVVRKFELAEFLHITHSGIHEPRGKPHPAVFLTAAKKLGVEPNRCLVFEDAPAGVAAGKAAGMTVIAVPSVFAPDEPGIQAADRVLNSLLEFEATGPTID
ncbi:MAG: hexitol phosphatase HxpB [Wenzhouxiangellaceae bacterium]|nr:hexitol phosphatase HxpB [Wenzhouxiangellaceae bacterium]MBS3746859.1 hexitol phosphatase HxpB [Wenzhouxiangellaceae bacterium]MBS3824139.1 hexitol phosphatase HxpB [Wenzhouxiangellaceae bacterium]